MDLLHVSLSTFIYTEVILRSHLIVVQEGEGFHPTPVFSGSTKYIQNIGRIFQLQPAS